MTRTQKVARVAAGGLGLLVAMEVALRLVGLGDPAVAIVDDEIEYYPAPGGSFHRFGHAITINRYGMRSPDFDKSEAVAGRVFLLGDSVVYGNHFLDQRETIAAQLSERLVGGAPPVAAIAASSWGPGNLLAYWRRFGPFSGEAAVVVQSAHDRSDVPFTSADIIPYRTRSSLCALDDALQIVVERTRRAVAGERDAPRVLSYQERLSSSERALRALIGALKPRFRQVILLYHPTLSELRGETSGEAEHFKALAAELGVAFGATLAEGRTQDELSSLFQDDIHPSARGAGVIAATLQALVGAEAKRARRADGGAPAAPLDGG